MSARASLRLAASVPHRPPFLVSTDIRRRLFAGEPFALVAERHGVHAVLYALGAESHTEAWVLNLEHSTMMAARRERTRERRSLALQLAIGLTGLVGAYLVALPPGAPLRALGFVVLLASQPLWTWASWRARQWGMLVLSIFYFGVWAQGVANHFL